MNETSKKNINKEKTRKIRLPISALILIITLAALKPMPSYAATPSLDNPSINLYIEESQGLKIKGIDKNLTLKWAIKDKNIASVSANGKIKGLAKGKTKAYARLYSKGKLKYTLKATVNVNGKGIAQNQKSFTKLLSNPNVSNIIIVDKANFIAPKKSYGKNLEIQTPSLSLKLNGTAPFNIVVLTKAAITIDGTSSAKDFIFIKEAAEETEITLHKNIVLYAESRTTLVVNKTAADSEIITLDYKVPVTLTNNTGKELIVHTPSVDKSIEPNSTHTVTGKN